MLHVHVHAHVHAHVTCIARCIGKPWLGQHEALIESLQAQVFIGVVELTVETIPVHRLDNAWLGETRLVPVFVSSDFIKGSPEQPGRPLSRAVASTWATTSRVCFGPC